MNETGSDDDTPTWRAYVTCYVEGLPLCRRFVAGDPDRFRRLITEQLTPLDLVSQVAEGAVSQVGAVEASSAGGAEEEDSSVARGVFATAAASSAGAMA